MRLSKDQIPKHVKIYPKWMKKLVKRYRGTSLYPFGIYVSRMDYLDMDTFLNHENIHWKQQKEMLVLPFYIWYGIEWIVNAIKYGKNKAYKKLSFEQESYHNEDNLKYLEQRKPYSWIKYLKFKPIN